MADFPSASHSVLFSGPLAQPIPSDKLFATRGTKKLYLNLVNLMPLQLSAYRGMCHSNRSLNRILSMGST